MRALVVFNRNRRAYWLMNIVFCCELLSRKYEDGFLEMLKSKRLVYAKLKDYTGSLPFYRQYMLPLNYCPYCGEEIYIDIHEERNDD